MDSKALTKIQTVALITIILFAVVASDAAYVLWIRNQPSAEDIKIGLCADLDMENGKDLWRGVTLAIEQVNAEGGVMGRNLTIVAEDDDSRTPPYDIARASNALTKLITVDQADYILTGTTLHGLVYQDICSEHEKISFSVGTISIELTQRVLDDYDKYKYFFRTWGPNATSIASGISDSVLVLRNYTGFNKVAILTADSTSQKVLASELNVSLCENGFNIVYQVLYPDSTTDFASYFAAIEASGAEILVPYVIGQKAVSFVKEWYDRQSPFVVWGNLPFALESDFWNLTDGKCEYISFSGTPAASGYPLTTKTRPTRDAYMQRWGENPSDSAAAAYDTVRFILPDAIKRAGTKEAEAVIHALEETYIETSMARRFVFTSSHDVMVGAAPNRLGEYYVLVCTFQWQNGAQVPVHPKEIMEEAEATYKYPPWEGAWSK